AHRRDVKISPLSFGRGDQCKNSPAFNFRATEFVGSLIMKLRKPLPPVPARKGSVLLVVLGLLLLLMLVGMTFFTFSSIEHAGAVAFSEANKNSNSGTPVDAMWAWGLS